MLEDLARRFGQRVRTVKLAGDEEEDQDRMRQAAPGPIDCVLDLLPPSAGTKSVRAAAMTVREFGRVVLMGGVGMLGGDDLAIPYPWIMRNSITIRGQFMYPREANVRLTALVRSGLLDLSQFEVTEFALPDANKAIAQAAAYGGPFKLTIIRP
jgi:alcohol dehydrogenase